jgi:hypothetical protein
MASRTCVIGHMPQVGEIAVNVSLQPADVFDPWRYTTRNFLRWLLALLGSFALFDSGQFWFPSIENRVLVASIAALSVLVCLALIIAVVPYLILVWRFRQYAAFTKPRRYLLDANGIHLDSEDARADYKWSLFTKAFETRKVFALVLTRHHGVTIPKRFLSTPGDIEHLRQLIRENFKGKRRLRTD